VLITAMTTNKKTATSSHDPSISNGVLDEIRLFIAKHSVQAITKTERRLADLMHYEQVRDRIAADEDLSEELPQLRNVDKAQAIKAINALIKAKGDEAASFWDLPSAKVGSEVKVTKHVGQNKPRYDVSYTFDTKFGEVDIEVTIDGEASMQKISTKNVAKSEQHQAYQSVAKQITLMRLQ
jgi:hypothetical protein